MSELSLIIGNKNYSSWSLRPWVFLKHNNIQFEETRVPLFTDTTRSNLQSYGSDFKVPVLKDKELVIWDSLSILEYLSENYLDSRGWPQDEKVRAIARSVSSEMHSSFTNLRNEMPMNCRKKFIDFSLSENAKNEIERIRLLWKKCRSEFGQNGEWLFGEYSIADAMYAPIALRFEGYGIFLDDSGNDYIQSVLQQPCIQEWIESGKLETEIIDVDEV